MATNWFDRLAGGTRGRLLTLLRRSEMSIAEMAESVGVSGNAVRSHVAALERDGMVEEAGVARDTGGKPARLYRLTADAEELFPKAYAFVLTELLQLLEERRGAEEVEDLLRELGARAAGPEAENGRRPEARVEAAADLLRAIGGDVDVERTENGWCLQGHGCPLSAVVTEQPRVCCVAQALIESITHREVTSRCRRGERPSCRFEVSA